MSYFIAEVTTTINKNTAYNSNLPKDRVHLGDVFVDPYTDETYVYTDTGWTQHSKAVYVYVTPTPDTEMILKWAKKKMDEEERLEALRKEYPALEEAIKNLEVIKTIVGANEG